MLVFNLIYSLVWTILCPSLFLAAHLWVPKWRDGLKMKFGIFPKGFFPQNKIWFHAVSVGELNALEPILEHYSSETKLLSVTTEAAYKLASRKFIEAIKNKTIILFYMPWDHPWIIYNTLNLMQPKALILMESEVWPSLILQISKSNKPIIILNAKLSDSSFLWYKRFFSFTRHIFNKISFVFAQSAQDSRKYISMGLDLHKVSMLGNMKFAVKHKINDIQAMELRARLGFKPEDIVLICASTHSEEEALLIAIFQELKTDLPQLRLIIAPRHPERFDAVEIIINSAAQLQPHRYSVFKEKNTATICNNVNDVLLLDTIGDLILFYKISNIAFVGGTINDSVGGHNVLEPAALGLPVLIGPHYHKNIAMIELLENAGGLEVAASKEEIRIILRNLIEDVDKRILMGAKGKNLVDKQSTMLIELISKLDSILGINQ